MCCAVLNISLDLLDCAVLHILLHRRWTQLTDGNRRAWRLHPLGNSNNATGLSSPSSWSEATSHIKMLFYHSSLKKKKSYKTSENPQTSPWTGPVQHAMATLDLHLMLYQLRVPSIRKDVRFYKWILPFLESQWNAYLSWESLFLSCGTQKNQHLLTQNRREKDRQTICFLKLTFSEELCPSERKI